MIDRGHTLPLAAQARQLGISRGSIYYLPRAVPDADLAIMRRIDELHLLYPFAGSRMLRDLLRQEGVVVGRLHVATLMKRMRIKAICRRRDCQEFRAGGHRMEWKGLSIWQSTRTFWTSCWLVVIRRNCSSRTVCSTH